MNKLLEQILGYNVCYSPEGGGGAAEAAAAEAAAVEAPAADKGTNVFTDDQVTDIMQRKGWDKITDEGERSRSVLEAYHVLEQKIGTATMTPPKPGEVSDWDGFKELGLPEEAKYEITRPEMPEGMEYNEALEGFMVTKMYDAKLLPFQVQAMVDGINEFSVDAAKLAAGAADTDKTDMTDALKKEWGGDYDEKTALSQQAARFFDIGKNDAEQLNSIMGSSKMVQMFAKIGEALGEDRLKGGETSVNTFGMTPEGAKAERGKLLADNDFSTAYYDKGSAGHKDAVAKINALQKIRAAAS